MTKKHYTRVQCDSGSDVLIISLGRPYPVTLPRGTHGASLNSWGDGSTLQLNMALPHPQPAEWLGFREGIQFGIYQKKDMPGGLIALRLVLDTQEPGVVFECPFDAMRQRTGAPESLARFFSAKRIAILATLTDTGEKESRVIAIRMLEMPPAMVKRLRELWQHQISQRLDYELGYRKLAKRKSLEQIWNEAEKF